MNGHDLLERALATRHKHGSENAIDLLIAQGISHDFACIALFGLWRANSLGFVDES